MSKLRIIVALLIVLCIDGAYGQNPISGDFIYWTKNNKITWSDFLGMPSSSLKTQYDTEAKAVSAVKIKYEMLLDTDWVKFNIYCCFNKIESWTKDTNSAKGLEHEQLHFDIGELYARKMRKEFNNLRDKEIYEGAIYDQKFDSILQACNDYQDLYDKETLHGAVLVGQQKWDKKILVELKELESYYVEYPGGASF